MKILIALPYFPYPPRDGGLQAAYYMIDYLRQYCEITLICPYVEEKNLFLLNKAWSNVTLVCATVLSQTSNVNEPDRASLGWLTSNIKVVLKGLRQVYKKKGIPMTPLAECDRIRQAGMQLYRRNFIIEDRAFVNKFIEVINGETFSIVQVEFAILLGLINCIPRTCRTIFVHHELSYKVIEREIKTLELVEPYEQYLYKSSKENEIAFLKKYDNIIVLSDQDRSFLGENISLDKIVSSPFALPLRSGKEIQDGAFSFKEKILFLGSDNHNPNLDAVYWFIKDILPIILVLHPNITFYIVGSWKKSVSDLLSGLPQVIFTGYVDNLKQLADGAVMIVPIRIGSGIRTKILDAVSWRIPILTTAIGVEGLPFENGVDCLIANEAEEFVDQLKLLYDNEFTNLMIENASQKLQLNSNLEKCGEVRKSAYKHICETEN